MVLYYWYTLQKCRRVARSLLARARTAAHLTHRIAVFSLQTSVKYTISFFLNQEQTEDILFFKYSNCVEIEKIGTSY